jgi:hypothetical protein
MKNTLLREINLDMRSLPDRADGHNWTTRGLRKSGRDYDDVECQREIVDFMCAHQEREDIPDVT